MVKFSVPLEVWISANKKFILNLNNYRNTHYQTLNKAKQEYAKLISPLIPIFKADKVRVEYVLYTKTKRKIDISNPCCIADKFVCDVLVDKGCIPDDDYRHVVEVKYAYGGIDPKDPRVEVTIIDGNS